MPTKKLNETGLSIVWQKVFNLIKLITGDVDVANKGDLQSQIDAINNFSNGSVLLEDSTIVFSDDGTTATKTTDNYTLTVSIVNDSTITETYKFSNGTTKVKTITINSNGSISEVIS